MIGNALNISAFGFPFRAITTVDINSQKVFKDESFSWSKRFSIAKSTTANVVIDPSLIPANKKLVVLPVTFKTFQAGPVNIDLYFGGTNDEDGAEWLGGNRIHESDTDSVVTVRFNPTLTAPGVKTPFEFVSFSNGTAAVASAGGESKDDLIFIARTDGKYRFEMTNADSVNDALGLFVMTLFEAELDV